MSVICALAHTPLNATARQNEDVDTHAHRAFATRSASMHDTLYRPGADFMHTLKQAAWPSAKKLLSAAAYIAIPLILAFDGINGYMRHDHATLSNSELCNTTLDPWAEVQMRAFYERLGNATELSEQNYTRGIELFCWYYGTYLPEAGLLPNQTGG